mgnify:CR=1 FL=1
MVLNALSNRQLRELAILAQLFQEVLIERNGRKWIPLVKSLRQHVDRATAVVTHAKNMSAELHRKSPYLVATASAKGSSAEKAGPAFF